ncbi:PREDICTED: uncharacterized protein LOC106792875 [Polistes canadensis]|uniref:uncharacterized protein LOC106792875 n=1 Tax=Polistes canadensis TaxID=91411 RepID=UPI000718FA78|nr:PREDICTED: uncharacterized protein LOC106792875 [Polistes canadensis]
MAIPKIKYSQIRRYKAYWRSRNIAVLRTTATAVRRRYLTTRRNRVQGRIDIYLKTRREAKRTLVKAIGGAKTLAWRDFLSSIEEDPWEKPYRLAMGKLRAHTIPVTDALEPATLDSLVRDFFPRMTTAAAPFISSVAKDAVTETPEEVFKAMRRIPGGRAPGLDRILGIMVQKTAKHCSVGPICLLDKAGELFEKTILTRVSGFREKNCVFSPAQHGFRIKCSTVSAINALKRCLQMCAERDCAGIVMSLDVSNTFSSLLWDTIMNSLVARDFPANLHKVSSGLLGGFFRTSADKGKEATPLQHSSTTLH